MTYDVVLLVENQFIEKFQDACRLVTVQKAQYSESPRQKLNTHSWTLVRQSRSSLQCVHVTFLFFNEVFTISPFCFQRDTTMGERSFQDNMQRSAQKHGSAFCEEGGTCMTGRGTIGRRLLKLMGFFGSLN